MSYGKSVWGCDWFLCWLSLVSLFCILGMLMANVLCKCGKEGKRMPMSVFQDKVSEQQGETRGRCDDAPIRKREGPIIVGGADHDSGRTTPNRRFFAQRIRFSHRGRISFYLTVASVFVNAFKRGNVCCTTWCAKISPSRNGLLSYSRLGLYRYNM